MDIVIFSLSFLWSKNRKLLTLCPSSLLRVCKWWHVTLSRSVLYWIFSFCAKHRALLMLAFLPEDAEENTRGIPSTSPRIRQAFRHELSMDQTRVKNMSASTQTSFLYEWHHSSHKSLGQPPGTRSSAGKEYCKHTFVIPSFPVRMELLATIVQNPNLAGNQGKSVFVTLQ